MPLYIDRNRLREADQAAAAASTQGLVDDVTRRYQEAQQPSYALPDMASLGVGGAHPSPVMAAIGAIPQIGRKVQQVAQEQAPSWALPTLDSLGVTQPKPAQPPAAASGAPVVMPTGGEQAATPSPRPMAASSSGGNHGEIDNSSRESFVRTAYPYMLEAAGGDQNLAELMLAKAISENGSIGTGRPFWANNFSGIKGEGDAGSVEADTWEDYGNGPVNIRDRFAAYSTPQAGMAAFMQFLRDNSRYHPALARYEQTRDASQLFRDIRAAGYATDPIWAEKVEDIRATQVAPVVRGQSGQDMPRLSLNAAPADAPGRAAPPAPAGVSSAPPGAPPAPWEMAGAQDGGPMLLKENDETANVSPSNSPSAGMGETFLPGDGGYAPTPYEQPYDPDQGPREATPGSVGAQPLPQTDQNYPMTYGPIQQGDVQGPPAPERPYLEQATDWVQRTAAPLVEAATNAYGREISEGNRVQDEIDAALDAKSNEFANMVRAPIDDVRRGVNIANRVLMATPQATADVVNAALERFGLGRDALGVDLPLVGRIGIADFIDLGPVSNIGMGRTGMVQRPAQSIIPNVGGAIEDVAGAGIRAAREGIRTGAEALGRGLQGVGREVAGGLMDLNPGMAPRMIGDGPGIGRSLPGPDDLPAPSSLTPPAGGRPQQRTVEWLAEQIDYTKRVLDDLDPNTEGELIGQVQDRLARLQGEWVDAVNARRALEPRIRSEVGRRVNELPIDERTASDYAGIGRERVSPEIGIPSAVDDTPRSPGLNSAVPGFDPGAAAMGGAAGAMSEGEDGEMDPLRTAAGIGLGMLGSRMARQPGKTFAFGAKPGERIEFNVKVVPLRDLITSHTDALSINRAFPQELQPRVRERTASKVQIDKIVSTFDPEQILVDSARIDSGPMIVGPDMVVESGNGRSIALRRLAKERPEAYAEYVQALRDELPRYGLTEDALQGIDQPVLVRERVTPMTPAERAQYAAEANVGIQARMAPVEQAMQDAGRISDDAVARIVVGEDQTIDEALMSAENGGFRRAFMATVPEAEWGELLTADGNLNPRGLARVKDALLSKTYQGSAGARLATAFVDSLDSGIKNVQHGIMGSLPTVARAEARIAAGELPAGMSIANDMAVAADVYSRLRRRKTILRDYLAQSGMFEGRETTPFQDRILAYLDENARSPKRIRAMLDEYARTVDGMAGADQVDMFGLPIPQATKEEVLDGVLRRLGAAPDADQGADLGRTGAGSNLVEGAGPGAAPVPPEPPTPAAARSAGSDAGAAPAGPQLTADEQLARFNAARGAQPLRPANLPPVADDLIPQTGGEAGRLQVEGAPQPIPRPGPVGEILPRTGGPEGTLAREGAPEPLARPTPIPRDVLPPTGGEAGTLAQEGAPPAPARPLAEVVQDIVGDGASRPVPVESPPGLNIRRLAKGIQLAAANPSPQIGLPGFPAPPPQASPNWWDLAQTWRYSMGLFGQLSTALVQGLGGVAEVGLGAPAELIRQAVVRGHPEHVPLIIGEALKSVPKGAKEFGTTAAGRVPATIMAGSDYRPPLSDQLTGGARTAARIIETPGRVATQAPDAFWYEVFYRTGLAQAAAEQATRKGASRLDPVGSFRMQQELIANPTAEMMERAHEFARSSTYKGELGSVAKAIGKVFRGSENPTSGLGKTWKEVGSFLMPVYHTIARIHEGALEYVPGIGALPLEAAGLAAKGRQLDQKIAQQVVGMAVAGSMLAYAAAGNVRGPGPNDPEKLKQMRDQGYEPNTTKVGDYWVPNAYFGRFGPILNAIGAMNDAIIYGDGSEQWNGARFDRQVRMVAKNFGRAFNDYPTAQAVSTLIKIKDDPVGALAEFAGGTAAQFVPAAYRSYATATDERVRRPERGKEVPPEQRFVDTFAQRSGVGRQSLPEAQDVLGRPVENQRQGANVLFPRVGNDRPDAVIDAFQKGGVDIPKPDDSIAIRNMVPESQRPIGSPASFSVALTPEEQREWNTLRGQELIKQTNILLARRGWSEKAQAQRQADLNAALEAARRSADMAMQRKLGTREINERIRSGLQKKAS